VYLVAISNQSLQRGWAVVNAVVADYVEVIWHEVTLLDPAFLLQRQLAEHLPQIRFQFPVKAPFCGTLEGTPHGICSPTLYD